MSAGYADKEREFLENLEDDTGLDLAAWMAAIKAQGLGHRNDIIDWLRQQGFMFSKASWIERIYHNGGRPIYLDAVPVKGTSPEKPAERPAPPVADPASEIPPAAPVSEMPPPAPAPAVRKDAPAAAADAGDPAALDELLSKAKAYRPLAQFLLAEISRAVAEVQFVAGGSFIEILGPRPFGILGVTAKELRLALDLGGRPVELPWKAAKFPPPSPRTSANLTHMLVLTDARQVNADLMTLVAAAAHS